MNDKDMIRHVFFAFQDECWTKNDAQQAVGYLLDDSVALGARGLAQGKKTIQEVISSSQLLDARWQYDQIIIRLTTPETAALCAQGRIYLSQTDHCIKHEWFQSMTLLKQDEDWKILMLHLSFTSTDTIALADCPSQQTLIEGSQISKASLGGIDRLTGLMDIDAFNASIRRLANNGTTSGILFLLDIDRFRAINEYYGMAYGDRILKRVANMLIRHVHREDIVSRWSGDQYLIFLSDYCPCERCAELVESIRTAIRRIELPDTNVPELTASIGVAKYDAQADSLESVVHQLEASLIEAKQRGRGQYIVL